MAQVSFLPPWGDVLLDTRGEGRLFRVSWHHDVGTVVLSLWHENSCTGTFRLAQSEVPALIQLLVEGLAESNPAAPGVGKRAI